MPPGHDMDRKDLQAKAREPKSKVYATGGGGAFATILIYAGSQLGIEIPPEVAAAFVTVVAFIAGYLKREVR